MITVDLSEITNSCTECGEDWDGTCTGEQVVNVAGEDSVILIYPLCNSCANEIRDNLLETKETLDTGLELGIIDEALDWAKKSTKH